MKNEAELNLIIKNSLSWGYKIPDPTFEFQRTLARSFDGFGCLVDIPVYWESKFSNKLKSFDLSRIEEHQIINLCALKALMPHAYCWVIYGVKVKRGDSRIWIFDDVHEINRRRSFKENFKLKELEKLPYLSIRNNLIDLTNYVKGVQYVL